MAANKVRERLTGIELKMPNVVIAPGDLLVFSQGAKVLVGIANDGQNLTTKPPYYSNSGYLSLDTEGAFNLTVLAGTVISPLTGSAVAIGDLLYLKGGTLDTATGITYGGTICKDSSGIFIGLAEAALVSGTTGVIAVSLKGDIS